MESEAESDGCDQKLIACVLSGRREAYAVLIQRHHPKVRHVCLAILDSADEADDAVQEVFLKAFSSLSDFKGRSAFATWLYRVAVNHCLAVRRKAARRREDSLDALSPEETRRVRRLVDGDRGSTAEDGELVERLLGRLEPDCRLILTLREMEGLEYRELMEALDCSLDAVKARLRRARQTFRELMGPILAAEGDGAGMRPWNTKR